MNTAPESQFPAGLDEEYEFDLWDQDESILGRLERFACDAPFQWIHRRVLEWRFERVPENTEPEESADPIEERLARSDLALVFGRPLTPDALTLYRFLKNRGMSVRDLRLAVFCRHITEHGTIRVNRLREQLLLATGIFLIAVTIGICVQLVLKLAEASVGVLPTFLVPLAICLVLLAVQYPWLVLTLRAPRVALRLERLWNTRS